MKRTKIRNILLSALLALTVGMPTVSARSAESKMLRILVRFMMEPPSPLPRNPRVLDVVSRQKRHLSYSRLHPLLLSSYTRIALRTTTLPS